MQRNYKSTRFITKAIQPPAGLLFPPPFPWPFLVSFWLNKRKCNYFRRERKICIHKKIIGHKKDIFPTLKNTVIELLSSRTQYVMSDHAGSAMKPCHQPGGQSNQLPFRWHHSQLQKGKREKKRKQGKRKEKRKKESRNKTILETKFTHIKLGMTVDTCICLCAPVYTRVQVPRCTRPQIQLCGHSLQLTTPYEQKPSQKWRKLYLLSWPHHK